MREAADDVPRRESRPEQLRAELRRYDADLLTDEVRAGLAGAGEGGDAWREVVRRIGKDGWLGIGWPDDVRRAGQAGDRSVHLLRRDAAPGTLSLRHHRHRGSDHHVLRHGGAEIVLPSEIFSGELNFAIGYTEPTAGTDLAALRTRAVRDGDEYIVNGAKIFTSGADMADYVWLAVRTDPEAPKHKGISILCVPTSSPGFSCSVINTVGGLTTTHTFYDDLRVPVVNRVGAENEGWRMITTQLNHERVGLARGAGCPFRCTKTSCGGRRGSGPTTGAP